MKYGCWKVSSTLYILDPLEAMKNKARAAYEAEQASKSYPFGTDLLEETDEDRRAKEEKKQRMDRLARKDANAFLQNGFFQDPAIARQGEDRILVASYGNWEQPLLSNAQAEAIQFYLPPPKPPAPMGKDAEILKAVISFSGNRRYSEAPVPLAEVTKLRNEIARLVNSGGSIARSHAIHAACANNSKPALDCLLTMDPSIVNSLDRMNCTPLMVAAQSAAGRSTINGIPETNVIDTLLAASANKQATDSFGLTAYGHFKRSTKDFAEMLNATMGKSCATSQVHPTEAVVERKLLPPLGPTAADMTGGEGEEAGFMDYSEADSEFDDKALQITKLLSSNSTTRHETITFGWNSSW